MILDWQLVEKGCHNHGIVLLLDSCVLFLHGYIVNIIMAKFQQFWT